MTKIHGMTTINFFKNQCHKKIKGKKLELTRLTCHLQHEIEIKKTFKRRT